MKPLFALCFALALVFSTGSCGDDGGGGGGGDSCSFDNCSGCCDGNQCITNTSTVFCGQGGNVCRSCNSGDICSAGSCTQSADCSQCPNSGCCLDGNQCQEGDSKQACGKSGNACQTCSGDDVCDSATNTCVASQCDSSTCNDGCCTANGVCKKVGVVDQSKDACGTGGAACETCAASDLSCSDGACVPMGTSCLDFCTNGCCMGETCVDFTMQDNAACGKPTGNTAAACAACTGEDNCAQGACATGPAWVITFVSATIAPTNLDGDDWDGFGGLPDAEVAGGLGGQPPDDFLSDPADDTLSAVWGYQAGAYSQADLIANGLDLVLTDDDFAFDDDMSECNFSFILKNFDEGGKTQAVCGLKVTDLRIDLTLVQ